MRVFVVAGLAAVLLGGGCARPTNTKSDPEIIWVYPRVDAYAYTVEVVQTRGVRLLLDFVRGHLVHATAMVRGRMYVSRILSYNHIVFMAIDDQTDSLICLRVNDRLDCSFRILKLSPDQPSDSH